MGDCDWEQLGRIASRIKWQFQTENLFKCLTSHRIAIVNDIYFECSLCDKKDRFNFFEIHVRSTLHRSRYERCIDDDYCRSQGFIKGTTKNKYFCMTCDDILVDENLKEHIESNLHKKAATVKDHTNLLKKFVNKNTKREDVMNGDDENDTAKIEKSINQDTKYDNITNESMQDEPIESGGKKIIEIAKVEESKVLEVSDEDAKNDNFTNEATKSDHINENGTESDETAIVEESKANVSNEDAKKEAVQDEESKSEDIKENGTEPDETTEGKYLDEVPEKKATQDKELKSGNMKENVTEVDETLKVDGFKAKISNEGIKKEVVQGEETKSDGIKKNGIELDEPAKVRESTYKISYDDAKKEATQNEEPKSESIKNIAIELDETAKDRESKDQILNEDAKKEASQYEELKSDIVKENGTELDETEKVGKSEVPISNEDAKKKATQDKDPESVSVKENGSRANGGPFGALDYPHHLPRVYFDLTSDGAPLGRLIFELRSDIAPRTCENFRCLCTGEKGFGYKGTQFDRVKSAFVCGGDVVIGNGTGGKSIYGKTFAHENYTLKHSSGGVLSMRSASDGDATSDSRFRLSTKPLPEYNNRRVAFGTLIDGAMVLKRITKARTFHGIPFKKIVIQDCGQFYY